MVGLPPWLVPQDYPAVPQGAPPWAVDASAVGPPPVSDELAGPPLPPWLAAPPVESYPEQQPGLPPLPPPDQTLTPPGMGDLAAPPPVVDPPPGALQRPVSGWSMIGGGGVPRGTPGQPAVPQGPPWGRNGPRMDPEAEAMAQTYDLRARQQERVAAGHLEATEELERRTRDNEDRRLREESIMDSTMADARAAWQKAGDAKVDPGRWWHSRSTGQKAATFIGAMLGGWLAVRQGTGKNSFMESITNAVHEDVAAQEFDINNAARAAQGQMSLLAQNQQIFTSRAAAREATAAGLYDAALRQTAAEGEQFESPITREAKQAAMVGLQKQRDASRAAAGQLEFENRLALDEQQRKDAETRSQIAKNYADAYATRHPVAKLDVKAEKWKEHQELKVVPNLLVPVLDERGRPVMQYQEVQDPQGNPVKPTPVIDGRSGKPVVDPKTGKPVYQEVEADKTGSTTVERVEVGRGEDGKPIFEDRVVRATTVKKPHVARDPKESEATAQAVQWYREYNDVVDGLDEARRKYGREWFKTAEGKQIYNLARERVIFATNHMHQGELKMTNVELNKFEKDIPDPSKLTNISDGEAAIKNMREFGRKTYRIRLDALGVPADAEFEQPEPEQTEDPKTIDYGNPTYDQEAMRRKEQEAEYRKQRDAALEKGPDIYQTDSAPRSGRR